MSTFIDFQRLKDRIRIDQAIPLLGLKLRQHGDQYRGPCPACKTGGERALAINASKHGYYCFAQRKGGDLIALVAHIRGMTQKDAAMFLDQHLGNSAQVHSETVHSDTDHSSRNSSPSPSVPQGRELKPLDYLVFNDTVAELGLSEATCQAWGAGYASKGIMRGRLAVPIRDRAGTLVAYVGIAVSEETSPRLHFPNGFDPHAVIFGADRVNEGELYLVRDPLDVLMAYQSGVENVVAFLAPITAQQVEMLAALMDAARCETVELFQSVCSTLFLLSLRNAAHKRAAFFQKANTGRPASCRSISISHHSTPQASLTLLAPNLPVICLLTSLS
jgi:DNA primase